MSKLKQQFADLRKSTPKQVQWLLMAAAFVLVLILLILLIGNNDKKNIDDTPKAPELKVLPSGPIDWRETIIGNTRSEKIEVSATAPVQIVAISLDKEVDGLKANSACVKMGQIGDKLSCKIDLTFAPRKILPLTETKLTIGWRNAEDVEAPEKKTEIIIKTDAYPSEIETVIEPEVIEEIKEEPEYIEEEPEYIEEEPTPIQQEIIREVEKIAPPIDVEPDEEYTPASEACSDFAFPGYNSFGRQIGWIKPSRGAYYFHPFSDTECNDPTGIYNPDNGIITEIDDPGKRIGTDAEHIGYAAFNNGTLPQLSNAPAIKPERHAQQLDEPVDSGGASRLSGGFSNEIRKKEEPEGKYLGSGSHVLPSIPYDRQFILRQYKPIPATIVSDVRADPKTLAESFLPVRATVDRNVYSDSGRNVIIPAGTLMLGYVTGDLPGPYASIGRMNIKWYQFILPNGMEYNFRSDAQPESGDSQGRIGIPGRGTTDYLEQFFMPMLTAMVPATINLIAPVSDAFVNQIDLDNNTVVQSGTMRSSEMAKNEIITAWNSVAQKLMIDMLDSSVPPFTIPAGTRITVYSPEDLVASCGDGTDGKKCSLGYDNTPRMVVKHNFNEPNYESPEWVGQARSFNAMQYCDCEGDSCTVRKDCKGQGCDGYSYQTLLFWCQSKNYKSKTEVKQQAYHESEKQKYQDTYGDTSSEAYEQMIGIERDEDGYVVNPFESKPKAQAPAETPLTCLDGSLPDENGCCAGEIYTDMGEQGFNCCPQGGGDCFPPIM